MWFRNELSSLAEVSLYLHCIRRRSRTRLRLCRCVWRRPEADNRTRPFKSTDVVDADPVSKNYSTSRHNATSPATPESSVSWRADGMLGTQGLQSMRMAIGRRPEQMTSTRLRQMWICITSHPSRTAGLATFIQHEGHKDSPEGRTCKQCFTTLGHNCRRWFPRSL